MRSGRIHIPLLLSLSLGLLFSCTDDRGEGSVSLTKTEVRLSAGSMFVSVSAEGPWTLSVQYEGEQRDWITLSRTSGTGSTNSVILSYTQNPADDPRSALITGQFGRSSESVRLVQTGKLAQVEGGEGTELPVWPDYPGLKSDVVRGWMELPAVEEDEGCAWIYHDMTVSGNAVRNYSMYYDAGNMLARWVAYPMNSTLVGSGTRTDDWEQTDPKIPSEYQPYTRQGWGKSGYDRGHQIPSADRLRSESNRATFYPTNMTVQDAGLNQGLWANLENKVRVWMNAFDTLYVCTGCLPSDRFHTDRGGNRVNIPQAYFKALLGYSISPESYSGIAFYFVNDDPEQQNPTRDMAISISDLEHLLGINLFVNLPDEYAAAEKTISSKWTF